MRHRGLFRPAISVLVILLLASPAGTAALSDEQRRTISSGAYYFNTELAACSKAQSGVVGANLEGHNLPAESGGIGIEEEAELRSDGRAYLKRNGAPLALPVEGMSEKDVEFYITMRWRYAVWGWDGTSRSTGAPESADWYLETPRKVLITNPETNTAIVASVIESGPAPWTGTPGGSGSKHSPPAYWQGYVDGTPEEYDGRVAGAPPKVLEAIGGPGVQWTRGGESGQKLYYTWADQSLEAGTVIENASTPSGTYNGYNCAGNQGAGIENFVTYNQYDPKWRDHPYGSSTVAVSGCGPSSVAMIVATFVDSSVTPADVADFGTANGTYIPNQGSSWTLMTLGPENWGLTSESIGTDFTKARQALQQGKLLIASGRGSRPFTTGGHIIVIRGIDDNGDFLVGDSGHIETNEQSFTEADLAESTRGMWAVSR